MAVTKHRFDKKSYETKPESKLSGTKFVTKPENRHVSTHNYGIGEAISKIKTFGSGK